MRPSFPAAHGSTIRTFDVLIIGSGLAGQSLALRLAKSQKVALVTKRKLEDSATAWAQGGIAAVLDHADSIESHIEDTLTAGDGLCDAAATRYIVEHSNEAVHWLINQVSTSESIGDVIRWAQG